MGKNTDMTGLQFRMLNTKKGPSVWAPRAQCDKKAYQFRLKRICEQQENLDVRQDQTVRLVHKDRVVLGVETALNVRFLSKSVIITTGTFLRGLMHVGSNQNAGGRAGESAALGLSASLQEIGLELGRLKTGTPPRLLRRSIDFTRTEIQDGDEPVPYFSYWQEDLFHVEHFATPTAETSQTIHRYPPNSILRLLGTQLPCYITYTTDRTAALIRENLHRSPLYSGVIEGVGPRYCPSIEDKIIKFPEKERQQIFLEPEGIATDEIYVNGFSTSLPFEVQIELVRSITGCENAEIMRPAYAVEYDFAFPTQLHPWLETKNCQNLFLAGQINGTSGYEEAAAQGLMAGINAARRIAQKPMIVLRRDQAYIGVLIDDLVTKGTSEPYRMFTSRAEYRLLLRQDNADLRLSELGYNAGLLPYRNFEKVSKKRKAIFDELARLEVTFHGSQSLAKILRRPDSTYRQLPDAQLDLSDDVIQQVETCVKYDGYISRQEVEVDRFKKLELKRIPDGFDYDQISAMRREARQKLTQIKPATVGQASRISGVSPADIGVLLVWLKRTGSHVEGLK
jgi:tRNA uridine 5-carboxymethylaminomethyl modification enzyme